MVQRVLAAVGGSALSSFPLCLGPRVGFGGSWDSPQQPQEFQSIPTLWMRSEMSPWWFSSGLVEMAPCSLRGWEREDSHPAQGQDHTAAQLLMLCSGGIGKMQKQRKETEGNRGTAPHPPPRAEPFADGPGPGMQKQKGCKCWLCISVSCHLCKRRPHARSAPAGRGEERSILKRSHHEQHCSCQ